MEEVFMAERNRDRDVDTKNIHMKLYEKEHGDTSTKFINILQVCLTWDNLAINMHELHILINSIVSLAVCQPLVQCACSSTNFQPISNTL